MVNRKGETLKQLIDRYTVISEYGEKRSRKIEYFTKKYCAQIKKFFSEVPDRECVISAVEKYDAAKITAEELVARFQQRLNLIAQDVAEEKNEQSAGLRI